MSYSLTASFYLQRSVFQHVIYVEFSGPLEKNTSKWSSKYTANFHTNIFIASGSEDFRVF